MNCIQKAKLELMIKNMYELRTQIAYMEEGLRPNKFGELEKLKIKLKMKEEHIRKYKEEIR